MSEPISTDLRERIVAAFEKDGKSYNVIASELRVARSTVARVLKRQRVDGTVEPRPRGGGFPPRLKAEDADSVRELVLSMPDASVQQLADRWTELTGRPASRSSFLRGLKKLGYTFKKKTFSASEKDSEANKQKKAKYEAIARDIDPNRLVFIDESGCNNKLVPFYGWGEKSSRLHDIRPMGSRTNVSLIGAVRLDGPVALRSFEGAVNGPLFERFLKQALGPRLRPGDIVIMDNLRAHHARFVKPLIESFDADVVYLPPYSPELNPIEHVWSVLKHIVRKGRFVAVDEIRAGARAAWRAIKSLDMARMFANCGYAEARSQLK